MLKTQNKNSHIEGRKVLNLCSNNCDSEWLLKNLAHSVYVLEPTKIMEKVKCGEIDTIFFRATDNSANDFKIMGKLLQETELKKCGCRLIVVDDTIEDNMMNYICQRMDDLLRFLGFNKQVFASEEMDYSVYD